MYGEQCRIDTPADSHAFRKRNTLDIHQIEFPQVQRDAWSATLDLRLQLIQGAQIEAARSTNARLALSSKSA